jgi:hypothetical protein
MVIPGGCASRIAAVVVAAGCVAGCAASAATPAPPAAPAAGTSTAAPGSAVGAPTSATRMICAEEARRDIAAALGVPVTPSTIATWQDGVYSCRYPYPAGSIALSVTQLADPAAATASYAAARRAAAHPVTLPGVGQEAFTVPDGSVYVRAGGSVLHVDVSGLPARFGTPPRPRKDVAVTVATTILHCWVDAAGG